MYVKLTDANDRTHGGMQWGAGVTHEAPGEGELCTSGWIHYYTDKYIAVLMNSAHADFGAPHGWWVRVEGRTKTDGTKCGAQRVTTVRRCRLPKFTTAQRVYFAILCAKEVYDDADWNVWADAWISGADRSSISARAREPINLAALAKQAYDWKGGE